MCDVTLSVTWPSLDVDRAAAILTPEDDHCEELMTGASAGPLWTGVCDARGTRDTVFEGSFHRFQSRPIGDQLSGILDEWRRLLGADGHRPVRRRRFLREGGWQRPFPSRTSRVETAEEVEIVMRREETDRKKSRFSADALRTLSDPLGTVESSMVLRIVGERGLSRGGSFVRRLTVQDGGDLRSRVLEKLGVSIPGRQAGLDKRLFWTDGSGYGY